LQGICTYTGGVSSNRQYFRGCKRGKALTNKLREKEKGKGKIHSPANLKKMNGSSATTQRGPLYSTL